MWAGIFSHIGMVAPEKLDLVPAKPNVGSAYHVPGGFRRRPQIQKPDGPSELRMVQQMILVAHIVERANSKWPSNDDQ